MFYSSTSKGRDISLKGKLQVLSQRGKKRQAFVFSHWLLNRNLALSCQAPPDQPLNASIKSNGSGVRILCVFKCNFCFGSNLCLTNISKQLYTCISRWEFLVSQYNWMTSSHSEIGQIPLGCTLGGEFFQSQVFTGIFQVLPQLASMYSMVSQGTRTFISANSVQQSVNLGNRYLQAERWQCGEVRLSQ